MTPTAIDREIENIKAGQQKLAEKMAAAKAKRRQQHKAEKQKHERRIGRLAMQFNLHLLPPEQLVELFQKAQPEPLEEHQNVGHASNQPDNDRAPETVTVMGS